MKEQSELTTIILALIEHLPALAAALFAYLSLRVGKKNEVTISAVQKEARETTATVKALASSDFSNR
jgi:hypothetical protein